MTRLALISDLHANELALEAVLSDAKRVGYDRLICLGDVATLGPRPWAVLDRLQDLNCACILGNHDEFMLDESLVRSYSESPLIVDSVDATRSSLRESDFAFIRKFERTLKLEEEDVFLYHASPRSNMEDLLATTPPEKVDEMLASNRARLLAGGHTHLQMLRQHHGMLIVNTGSLGMPFQDYASGGPPVILPHAEYAIITLTAETVSVDLRQVSLPKTHLASQVDGWDNPLAKPLKASYA